MKKVIVALVTCFPAVAHAHPGHAGETFAHMPAEWIVAASIAVAAGAFVLGKRALRNRNR